MIQKILSLCRQTGNKVKGVAEQLLATSLRCLPYGSNQPSQQKSATGMWRSQKALEETSYQMAWIPLTFMEDRFLRSILTWHSQPRLEGTEVGQTEGNMTLRAEPQMQRPERAQAEGAELPLCFQKVRLLPRAKREEHQVTEIFFFSFIFIS